MNKQETKALFNYNLKLAVDCFHKLTSWFTFIFVTVSSMERFQLKLNARRHINRQSTLFDLVSI